MTAKAEAMPEPPERQLLMTYLNDEVLDAVAATLDAENEDENAGDGAEEAAVVAPAECAIDASAAVPGPPAGAAAAADDEGASAAGPAAVDEGSSSSSSSSESSSSKAKSSSHAKDSSSGEGHSSND